MIAQAHYPVLLYEAVLKLYLQSEAGGTGEEVWFGACAANLKLHDEFSEVLLASSGDAYRTAYHVDEEHTIEIERLWILRKAAAPYAAH